VTLGGTIGDVTVDAEVAGLTGSPVTFTEHTIALPTAIVIDVGSAGFTFSPKVDTVAAGGTVTWNWGGNGHSVISDGPETFTSHATLESAGFTYGPLTLNTVGTYKYHCSAHGSSSGGGMAGTIEVR
jgi:plastocyanin